MYLRRITLAAGAATGGVLAAAFLSAGVALADGNDAGTLIDVAGSAGATAAQAATTPTVESVYGFTALGNPEVGAVSGIPPYFQDFEANQAFTTAAGGTTANPIAAGQFLGEINQLTYNGGSNEEVLVTNSSSMLATTDPTTPAVVTTAPLDGSVYDVANFGSGYVNEYSDVLTAPATGATLDTSTVTDMFVTPFYTYNLTPYIDFMASLDPSLFDLAPFISI